MKMRKLYGENDENFRSRMINEERDTFGRELTEDEEDEFEDMIGDYGMICRECGHVDDGAGPDEELICPECQCSCEEPKNIILSGYGTGEYDEFVACPDCAAVLLGQAENENENYPVTDTGKRTRKSCDCTACE